PFARTHRREPAVLEMQARMAEARHQRLVMRGDDDGGAQLVHLLEQAQQAERHLVVDIAGGLVGEQQAGSADHRAGNGDALLLAPRQRCRLGVKVIGKADPAQQLDDVLAYLLLRETGDPERQRRVVEGGEVIDQAKILEHDADAPAQRRQLAARRRRGVAVEQRNEATRRMLGEVHEFEQRALAGAARSGQEVEGAGGQAHADVAEHFRSRAVPHADILEPDQGARSPSASCANAGGTMARCAGRRPDGLDARVSCLARRSSLIRKESAWASMIVTCPVCSTRYLVDPRALGSAGRLVRCANCSHTWQQAPPEDAPRRIDLVAPQPELAGAPGGRVQLPALPPQRRRSAALLFPLLALFVLIGATGAGLWLARAEVVNYWPPAAT